MSLLSAPTTILAIPYFILLAFATVEFALVSRMVFFLHWTGINVGTYHIVDPANQLDFFINVKPHNLQVNQGHATNGTAGYGVVLCIVFLITLVFLPRVTHRTRYTLLKTMTILLSLLVIYLLATFIYVFVVTYQTFNNTIDAAAAAMIVDPSANPYVLDTWTPETWYRALQRFPIETSVDIRPDYNSMVVWRWWILPYLFVSAGVCAWTARVMITEKRRRTAYDTLGSELHPLK